MNVYRYRVTLEVEVEAFHSTDANDAMQDAFGPGENCGTTITNCEYTEVN